MPENVAKELTAVVEAALPHRLEDRRRGHRILSQVVEDPVCQGEMRHLV